MRKREIINTNTNNSIAVRVHRTPSFHRKTNLFYLYIAPFIYISYDAALQNVLSYKTETRRRQI